MEQTLTLTIRMPRHIRDYLRNRAGQHDRSMNGEILRILRNLAETEMASGAQLGGPTPDADTTECEGHMADASG